MPLDTFLNETADHMVPPDDNAVAEALKRRLPLYGIRTQAEQEAAMRANPDAAFIPSQDAPWVGKSFLPEPPAKVRFMGDPQVIANMSPEEKEAMAKKAVQPETMTGGLTGGPMQSFTPPPTARIGDIVNRNIPTPEADYSILRKSSPTYMPGSTRSDVLRKMLEDQKLYDQVAVTPGALSQYRAKAKTADDIANAKELAQLNPAVMTEKERAAGNIGVAKEQTAGRMAELQAQIAAAKAIGDLARVRQLEDAARQIAQAKEEGTMPSQVRVRSAYQDALTAVQNKATSGQQPTAEEYANLQRLRDEAAKGTPEVGGTVIPGTFAPSPQQVVDSSSEKFNQFANDAQTIINKVPGYGFLSTAVGGRKEADTPALQKAHVKVTMQLKALHDDLIRSFGESANNPKIKAAIDAKVGEVYRRMLMNIKPSSGMAKDIVNWRTENPTEGI